MDVLVVDDEEDLRVLLDLYLRGRGHSPVLAGSAGEARAALAGQDFGAMLLDVTLPDEDGPSLVRSLREHGNLPERLVLVSAVRPAVLVDLAAELDAVHLAKPFNIVTLDEVLGPLLSPADEAGAT